MCFAKDLNSVYSCFNIHDFFQRRMKLNVYVQLKTVTWTFLKIPFGRLSRLLMLGKFVVPTVCVEKY